MSERAAELTSEDSAKWVTNKVVALYHREVGGGLVSFHLIHPPSPNGETHRSFRLKGRPLNRYQASPEAPLYVLPADF